MKSISRLVGFAFGVWLLVVAFQMSQATLQTTHTESTKGRNTAIGASTGAAVGLGAWLLIGTVGIATGGWGFALGALGFTAVGAGSGAVAGAATGSTTVVIQSLPLYTPWAWGSVLGAGAILLLWNLSELKKTWDGQSST